VVTIYADYGDEPEDDFLPLPEHLSCSFYALEMDGFTDDIHVFNSLLPPEGRILELGCGTGRIAGALAGDRRPVTGIDLSPVMVQLALQKQHPHCDYLCMDMTRLAFQAGFDHIIIGYNTLNLLCSKASIVSCLRECGRHLHPGGTLLLQLFLPAKDFIARKKSFQFQIFDRPGGGKIIKEIIKRYSGSTKAVHVSERFRVRPTAHTAENEDYQTSYSIAGYSVTEWFSLLGETGFTPSTLYGDYSGETFCGETTSMLLGSFTSSK
jgi:SAM-dependent methyltransferase